MANNDTPPPEKKEVPTANSEDSLTSHNEYSGFRGRDGATNILQSDGDNPEVILQSTGNIYLDATAALQSSCSSCIQSVRGPITQYFNEATRNVVGSENTLIGLNQEIFVNGNRSVEVVGEQSFNIAQNLNTTVGQEYEIEVEGTHTTTVHGERHVNVDMDIDESTDAGKTLTTKEDYTRNISKDSYEYVTGNKFTEVSGDSCIFNLKDNVIQITSDGQIIIYGKSKTSIIVENGDVDVNGKNIKVEGQTVNVTGQTVSVVGEAVDVASDKGTVNINGQGGNVNIGSDTAVNLTGNIIRVN